MEHFHSRGLKPCTFIVVKERVKLPKIGLRHKHGCSFVIFGKQNGCRRDVILTVEDKF